MSTSTQHRQAPTQSGDIRSPRTSRGSERPSRVDRFHVISHIILVVLCVAVVVPVIWVFLASLKEKVEFYGNPWALPKGFAWSNFVAAFVDANMGAYLLNSVLVTAMALVLSLVIAVPAGYVLARFEFRGKSVVEAFLMAGLFINVNYIVVPIFLLLLGGDDLLRSIAPDGFLLNNLFVLALVYAATSVPFTTYLLSNYFRSIPKDFEEAAALDGASRLRTMTRIMIPMAGPAINTVILFNFLSFWNDFILSLTLISGDAKTVQVGLLNLFQAQRAAADYGRLYAGMVIVMIPVLVLYVVIQRRLVAGVSGGVLK